MWQYTSRDELYHYGVKGMKWRVRRARGKGESGAQRSAKKLATLKAKEYSKAQKVAGTMNAMNSTNSHENRQMARLLKKQIKQLDKATRKAEKFMNKTIEKYKNTKFSDIHVSEPRVNKGRTYVYTAMGKSGYEDGGYPLFRVTSGSSVKNR